MLIWAIVLLFLDPALLAPIGDLLAGLRPPLSEAQREQLFCLETLLLGVGPRSLLAGVVGDSNQEPALWPALADLGLAVSPQQRPTTATLRACFAAQLSERVGLLAARALASHCQVLLSLDGEVLGRRESVEALARSLGSGLLVLTPAGLLQLLFADPTQELPLA
jgi:hypothetical protein